MSDPLDPLARLVEQMAAHPSRYPDGALNALVHLMSPPEPRPSDSECLIGFSAEAHDSAADILRGMCRRDGSARSRAGRTGYCVTVHLADGTPAWDAEMLAVRTIERDDLHGGGDFWHVDLAPWPDGADAGDRSKVRTVELYAELDRLVVT